MQNYLIQSLKSATLLAGLAAVMVMVPKPAMAQCDPYDAFCNLGISSASVGTSSGLRPSHSMPPAACPRGTRSANDGSCRVISIAQQPRAMVSPPQTVNAPQTFSRPQVMSPPQTFSRPQVMGSVATVNRPQVMSAPQMFSPPSPQFAAPPQFAAASSEYQSCPEGTVQQPDKSCHVQRVEIDSKLTQALAKAPMMSGQPVYNADGTVAGTVIIMTDPTGSISVPGGAFPMGHSSP